MAHVVHVARGRVGEEVLGEGYRREGGRGQVSACSEKDRQKLGSIYSPQSSPWP
jgi:hypothetical protein